MGDFANNPMGMIPLRKLIAQAGYTWQEYQDHLYKSMALLSFFKALPPETANAYVHSVELCSSPSKLSGCSQEDACCIAMFRTLQAQTTVDIITSRSYSTNVVDGPILWKLEPPTGYTTQALVHWNQIALAVVVASTDGLLADLARDSAFWRI
ncbi:Cant1 [Symbiodinium natans]|uniref:Cant1 protein n=1 Tax=Symbiodinium natans TaxID=878477 RepID=A0A812RV68_9DINO|nr:Cant1 [Symbiodinium natans]